MIADPAYTVPADGNVFEALGFEPNRAARLKTVAAQFAHRPMDAETLEEAEHAACVAEAIGDFDEAEGCRYVAGKIKAHLIRIGFHVG